MIIGNDYDCDNDNDVDGGGDNGHLIGNANGNEDDDYITC